MPAAFASEGVGPSGKLARVEQLGQHSTPDGSIGRPPLTGQVVELACLGVEGRSMEVPVVVAGSPVTVVVDTAAQVTIMSKELSRELGLGVGSCDPIRLVTADGTSLVGRLIPAVLLQ